MSRDGSPTLGSIPPSSWRMSRSSRVLYDIHRTLENLIHGVFGLARLDIEIKDRFGQRIIPHQFLVPLFVIDEAVERIRNGTITEYAYDPNTPL
jgi:hypothetical protein